MKSLVVFLSFIVFLYADEIPKKIKDIEINTMKYLSTEDIQNKYDPTKDAKKHIRKKPYQRIEIGFSNTSGNTKTTSLNANYTFSHIATILMQRQMHYTFEASAFLAKDDGKRTAEEYKVFFNAKQPLPGKWLSYLSLGWLKNIFQNYANKVDLSVGMGRVLFKDQKQSFIVKLGPAINYENYDSGGDSSYASLNQYLEYKRFLYDKNRFYCKVGAKENFSDMKNDYEVNVLIGFRFRIVKKFHLVVEYNAFYDNKPSEGVGKTDTKSVIRLGYNF